MRIQRPQKYANMLSYTKRTSAKYSSQTQFTSMVLRVSCEDCARACVGNEATHERWLLHAVTAALPRTCGMCLPARTSRQLH